jgi:selenide,water dikinase
MDLLFDPETSGGLLLAVPAGSVDKLAQRFAEQREPLWYIGEVVSGRGIHVV